MNEYIDIEDIDVEGIANSHGYDILLDDDISAYSPKGTYGYNPDTLKRNTLKDELDNITNENVTW